MLNLPIKLSSAPISDAELSTVIAGIRPAIAIPGHPDKDYALLLARMVFRINELKAQIARTKQPEMELHS